jgi:hypothetical protein
VFVGEDPHWGLAMPHAALIAVCVFLFICSTQVVLSIVFVLCASALLSFSFVDLLPARGCAVCVVQPVGCTLRA